MERTEVVKLYRLFKKYNGEALTKALVYHNADLLEIPNLSNMLRGVGHVTNPMEIAKLLSFIRSSFFKRMVRPVSFDERLVEEAHQVQLPLDAEKTIRDPMALKMALALLKHSGYHAFYVTTTAEKNSIRPYFHEEKYNGIKESLCTFFDPLRHQTHFMIHCIGENADQIKRRDYPIQSSGYMDTCFRQNAYGVSVISIQIDKATGGVSITNRYNDSVFDADSTFDRNPDEIQLNSSYPKATGLSWLLQKAFNVDFESETELPKGYLFVSETLIKVSYQDDVEMYNPSYFSPYCYVSEGKLTFVNRDTQLVFDNYVLDLKEKKLIKPSIMEDINWGNAEEENVCSDTFLKVLKQEFFGKNVSVKCQGNMHLICADEIPIVYVKDGKIVGLYLPTVRTIDSGFLSYNETLEFLDAPNVEEIGTSFLQDNRALVSVKLAKVKIIKHMFLQNNTSLSELYVPCLEEVGNGFCEENLGLKAGLFPSLKKTGVCFFKENRQLEVLEAPCLEELGNDSFQTNKGLPSIHLDNLRRLGISCFQHNKKATIIFMPMLTEVGDYCFYNNGRVQQVYWPRVAKIGKECFVEHKGQLVLTIPSKTKVPKTSFSRCQYVREEGLSIKEDQKGKDPKNPKEL